LKIAIAVPGRFHAFNLAKALALLGHEVVILTNYPKWAVKQFGIPPQQVRSLWIHGVVSRVFFWLTDRLGTPYPEAFLHRWFGRWVKGVLTQSPWDVVHPWSGVSEESFTSKGRNQTGLRLLMRGSTHIRTQARILRQEQDRVGTRVEQPSRWMIEREEREYKLADRVVVLSTFARESFLQEGVPSEKLLLLPLGADVRMFRPSADVVEERCRRVLAGEPLRVLYVGTLSFRKGLWDLGTLVYSLGSEPFRFRALGPIPRESTEFLRRLKGSLEIVPKQSQRSLPFWYRWADLFIFPTLEDGYPIVLAQAQASGLPILTTTNCCGPDLVQEGKTGWIFPIRSPQTMADRLRWCHGHRRELAEMTRSLYQEYQVRDWSDVAKAFEMLCQRTLAERPPTGRGAAEGRS